MISRPAASKSFICITFDIFVGVFNGAALFFEGDCGARAGRGSNSISMIEYPLDKGREEFQEGGYLFSPLLGVSLHTFWTKPESMGLHGLSAYKK